MAVTQTKDPLGISRICWQDVIDFDAVPLREPDMASKVRAHPSADREKVITALQNIENTENGQLLFQGLLREQLNPDLNHGAGLNKKVHMVHVDAGSVMAQAKDQPSGDRFVLLNLDEIKEVGFITPAGKHVHPLREDFLFHELSHLCDKSGPQLIAAVKKWEEKAKEHEIILSSDKYIFDIDKKGRLFIENLPADQKEALNDLLKAKKDVNVTADQFAELYHQKLPLLVSNPVLKELSDAEQTFQSLRMGRENQAMNRSNAFLAEFIPKIGKEPYVRGHYDAVDVSKAFISAPDGFTMNEFPLTPKQREENNQLQQQWREQFGDPVRDPHSTIQQFNPVALPSHMQKLLLDIPLAPSLLQGNIQHISDHISLTPSQVTHAQAQNSTRAL